jgi:DNA-binding XRE family transcriptional regulator
MADVITIAKERRAMLLAEVRKLDDFIQMGEALKKLGHNAEGAPTPLANEADGPAETAKPVSLFGVVSAPAATTAHEDPPAPEPPNSAAAPAQANLQQSLLDSAAAERDQFLFTDKVPPETRSHDDVLVLNDPVSSDPASIDVHIGQKLRQRRWMVGLSRNELGRQVGVASDQIQKYEAGEIHISSSRMWDIAAALSVPMSYFFEDIEGQAPDASEARAEVLTGHKLLAVVSGDAPARATAQAS